LYFEGIGRADAATAAMLAELELGPSMSVLPLGLHLFETGHCLSSDPVRCPFMGRKPRTYHPGCGYEGCGHLVEVYMNHTSHDIASKYRQPMKFRNRLKLINHLCTTRGMPPHY